ncbi:MAG: type III-B CRISPR module RAMP protein Cmr6, partial [Deltaproteobacteria bacterium]
MGPKNQRNHYPLPEADRISWDEVSRRASNFGLLFQRMIGYPKRWAIDGDEKKRMWDRLVQENGNQIFRDKPFQALYAAVAERRKTLFKDLEGSGCRVRSFELRLEERLSIGFGTESALETGITLHRLYGMPYLPGSAIKGVTRHHRFFEIAERIGVRPLMPKEIERRKSARRPTPWKLLETILTTRIPEEGKA